MKRKDKITKGRKDKRAGGSLLSVAALLLLFILFSCNNPEENNCVKLPTVESFEALTTGPYTAVVSFSVSSDGDCTLKQVGVCWSTSANPTISLDTKIIIENPVGNSFDVDLTDLQLNTKYYTRAFVTNDRGMSYSNQIQLVTEGLQPPVVGTLVVKERSISNFGAVLQFSIESLGNQPVTSAGVCWSRTPNPIIGQSSFKEITETPGIGLLELEITEFEDNTTYYARAYVQSDAGIGYSEQITFKTLLVDYTVNFNTVITENFAGIGTQYNGQLHLKCSYDDYGITQANLPDLEAKVKKLGSQYVRIFFSSRCWNGDGDHSADEYRTSFYKVVELANATVKVINITYWHDSSPADMPKFAEELYEMIVTRGFTNVKQVTIQNEVNSTSITMDNYQLIYRRLDQELIKLGIRDRIDFVSGDLIDTNRPAWFEYIGKNMSDISQGYSAHCYWNWNDAARPENMQKEIVNCVNDMGANKKPVYLTEFGVRAVSGGNPGLYQGVYPMTETTINARLHLMFIIRGMNRGIAGFVKWDCFRAKYTHTGDQYYCCIGNGTDGYPLLPVYHALRLFTLTSESGWKVVSVSKEVSASRLVTAVKSPDDAQHTIYALNNATAASNMSISGLPPNKTYHVIAWNKTKDILTIEQDLTVAENGVLTAPVSAESMIAITTLQVNL